MRLLSPNALGSLTLTLTLAIGCSGEAPTDDVTDATGGSGGQGSGGEGSGGETTDGDGSGGDETDGSGGEGSSSGGAGTGGEGSGGDASGGSESSGGGFGGAGTGGQGGSGTGGDGSGGSSGQCTNGDTQAGTTPCGNNLSGTLVQSCEDGVWTDTAVCDGGDECENDDERILEDFCGQNGRGDLPQVCVDGVWSGSDCDDPDECTDGDDQIAEDACGLNQRGELAQLCVEGLWEDGDCDDPDECTDGDDQIVEDACGLNDRGDLLQLCVEGFWDEGDCDDPDECEDATTGSEECLSGSGQQDLLCVEGSWEPDGSCTLLTLYRASVSSAGVEGNGASTNPSLSADGRYVAFESTADNLVEDDDNAASDIFVHDLQTGETRRVSLGSIVGQDSYNPSISGDGRYVAFHSEASDLVLNDLNTALDVFVTDLQANTTTRVSVESDGDEVTNVNSDYPRISADGDYVVFRSSGPLEAPDTNFVHDVFLHDRTTGTTTRVSESGAGQEANSYSDSIDIAPDGTRFAFHSAATNIVTPDTNTGHDVFVRNVSSPFPTLASRNSAGVQGNASSKLPVLSTTGRYIAFESTASNLTSDPFTIFSDVYLRDTTPETTELISRNAANEAANAASVEAAISGDARYVAFLSAATNLTAGDSDALYDVYVRDRQTTTVFRFAGGLASVGWMTNRLDLSTDGAFLAYPADDATLVENDDNGVRDVFIAPIEQGSGG